MMMKKRQYPGHELIIPSKSTFSKIQRGHHSALISGGLSCLFTQGCESTHLGNSFVYDGVVIIKVDFTCGGGLLAVMFILRVGSVLCDLGSAVCVLVSVLRTIVCDDASEEHGFVRIRASLLQFYLDLIPTQTAGQNMIRAFHQIMPDVSTGKFFGFH
jgi:hypothetical protein